MTLITIFIDRYQTLFVKYKILLTQHKSSSYEKDFGAL